MLVPAALAAFFTSVAGLLSLIATGTTRTSHDQFLHRGPQSKLNLILLAIATTGSNPHFASVAANEKQNALVELENDFASLAIDLLKMYKKPLPIIVTGCATSHSTRPCLVPGTTLRTGRRRTSLGASPAGSRSGYCATFSPSRPNGT